MDITINWKCLTLLLQLLAIALSKQSPLPTRQVVQSSISGPNAFDEHDDDVASLYSPENRHFTFKMIEQVAEMHEKHEISYTHTQLWDWVPSYFKYLFGTGAIDSY